MYTLFVLLVLCIDLLYGATAAHSVHRLHRLPQWHSIDLDVEQYVSKRGIETGSRVAINGSVGELGEYYVWLSIGDDNGGKNLQAIILDTGSSDFIVAGDHCAGCPATSTEATNRRPPYKATAAARNVSCPDTSIECANKDTCMQSGAGCQLDLTYADQSGVSGYFTRDRMVVGDRTLPQATFVVATKEDGWSDLSYEYTPSGIWGLSWAGASDAPGSQPLFDQLVAAHLYEDMFAICLDEDGGTLVLGERAQFRDESVRYTKFLDLKTWYQLNMTGMAVGTHAVEVSAAIYNTGVAMFDTGTELAYVPSLAYSKIIAILESLCPKNDSSSDGVNLRGVCDVERDKRLFDGYCYAMSDRDVLAFPNITLKFEGLSYVVEPRNYLIRRRASTTDDLSDPAHEWFRCLGIYGQDEAEGTLLGQAVMMGVGFVHDRKSGRFGIGPSDVVCGDGAVPSSGADSGGDGGAAVLGIIIAVVLLGALLIGGVWFYRRRRDQYTVL